MGYKRICHQLGAICICIGRGHLDPDSNSETNHSQISSGVRLDWGGLLLSVGRGPGKGEGRGLLSNEKLVSAVLLIMWFHVIKKLISAMSIQV